MATKNGQAQDNSLLVAYDRAIHEVTEQFRADHPSIWFAVDSTHVQEAHKPAPKLTTPKVMTPPLQAYTRALNEVTEQFNSEHKDWLFFYRGAKAQSLMQAGSIKHDTQPIGIAR